MKRYFVEDPLYGERFSDIRLWSEWAARQPSFDAADIGHQSRGRGARRRRVRHPVQVLRAGHRDIETRPRLVHRRLGPRPVHGPHRRRCRRRVGSERRQDHRAAQARMFRTALRRSGEPPVRLAGPRSQPTGRPVLPARTLRPTPTPTRREGWRGLRHALSRSAPFIRFRTGRIRPRQIPGSRERFSSPPSIGAFWPLPRSWRPRSEHRTCHV